MSSHSPEEKAPPQSSLQAMLARLRGMMQALKSSEPPPPAHQELLPTWDEAPHRAQQPPPAEELPPKLDQPVLETTAESSTSQLSETLDQFPAAAGETRSSGADAEAAVGVAADNESTLAGAIVEVAAPQLCPHCRAPRKPEQVYCDDCGWIFPPPQTAPVAASGPAPERIKARYSLGQKLAERDGITRFRGFDHGPSGDDVPVAVTILRAPCPAPVEAAAAVDATPAEKSAESPGHANAEAVAPDAADKQNETADSAAAVQVEAVPVEPVWPGLAWEQAILERAAHSSLPSALDRFTEGEYEYLIESAPLGQVLWDAWDEPQYRAEQRFGWLKQIAGALHRLHQSGAILEGLRPDIVTITGGDHATITDVSDLLPLPVRPDTPIKATFYTAPELVLFSEKADARSDLYSFGAMLYALHMGRELTDLDFELQGVPRSLYQRFADIHPLFGRLVSKTFCRELARRFPTEDAAAEDPSGFAELIRVLETCRRTLDHVRLDIAAWTTTGMVRSGNEDAFALLHATESSENTLGDCALVLLADGMGGYEAGEVAAAMAIQAMRKYLLAQKAFAPLAGEVTPLPDEKPLSESLGAVDRGAYKQLLAAALKQANKDVYMASHGAAGRRGMGCTAEAVYVSRSDLVIGHVGDSRTYHLQAGVLSQVTRDQTWVNRMVELGAMTPEEAEQHPRRSELQQAIGGYPDVEPALYDATLKSGDWVVICSDGLTNHVDAETLKDVLQRAASAEAAARRLVNLANLHGATDNVTVVAIRAT